MVNRGTAFTVPLPLVLAAQGIAAAYFSHRWGLARWWLPVQLLLPAAFAGALALDIPSWIYLVAFFGLLLVYWNTTGERVPLYLTNQKTWAALANLLPTRNAARFIDLGSGLGGTTLYLGGVRADMQFDAVENAPGPYVISKIRQLFSHRSNTSISYGSLWNRDLSNYNVVYCFLSPAPMADLFAKARAEMKTGSLFISNSFEVPGEEPDEIAEVDDGRRTKLLIWRM